MAETAAMLPRNEINFIAFDPTGANAVQTLIESAAGMLRTDDGYWTDSEKVSELLTELENAVAILRKRCDHLCDHLCERDYAY
jgi:hypothetical protein